MNRIYFVLIIAGLTCGCGGENLTERIVANQSEIESKAEKLPLEILEQRHNFGTVIGRPGKKLKYSYAIKNKTNRPINFHPAINHKPCCGNVALGRTRLLPGESTNLDVTVLAGNKYGEITHEAEIVTEPRLPGNIEFTTSATVIPNIQMKDENDERYQQLVQGGASKELRYRLVASGTPDDPPLDVDHITLDSTLPARWNGNSDSQQKGGIAIKSRVFAVTLANSLEAGTQFEEVKFLIDSNVVYTHRVDWEVLAPVSCTPKLIIVKPGPNLYKVIVSSHDGKSFSINKYSTDCSGLRITDLPKSSAQIHVVQVEVDGEMSDKKGSLILYTDHEKSKSIIIPVKTVQ